MRVAWLFGLALEPLSPLTFDASFDDYDIAPTHPGVDICHVEELDADESDDAH